MDLETYALLKKKINNISANNISYDNSQSTGLISTNVNDALDELSTKLGIKMVTVSELPLVGDPDILYIVPKSMPEQGNYSDEYTWNATRQDYDKIGDTLISPLPDVTSSDNGKVLGVVNGEWDKYAVPKELPTVSSSDNGNVLSVVSGSWNKKSLTKSDVGLGNVDNTSDLNKPISTATQSALDTKLSEDDLYNMTEDSTVSGNPVTLKTLAKTSAKSCEVTFSPIQSGSGDPSPTNIRPIIGRDNLVIRRDAGNIFDKTTVTPYKATDADGNIVDNENFILSDYISVSAGDYTLEGIGYINTAWTLRIHGYDSAKTWVSQLYTTVINSTSITNVTFTVPNTVKYIRFSFGNRFRQNIDTLYLYANATTETHTATFDNTVYGGKLDFVSGKLTITDILVDLGTLTWTKSTSYTNTFFFASFLPGNEDYPKTDANDTMLCTNYKKFNTTSVTAQVFGANAPDKSISINKPSGNQFYIRDDDYSSGTGSAFKTAMSGVYIAYKIETPREITLTPETIELLKGNNVLFTDGDNLEIVYTELDLTELPDVTSADEGKVLTVNSIGAWVAQTLPDGTNISY